MAPLSISLRLRVRRLLKTRTGNWQVPGRIRTVACSGGASVESVPGRGRKGEMGENAIFAGAGRLRCPRRVGMAALGVVLLAAWLVWLAASVRMNRLCAGRFSWLPVWDTLGMDFYTNYWCARSWLAGADP